MSLLVRRSIAIGLLIAVGSLANDMYVPGFAIIARSLNSDMRHVQLSMTSYFMAFAAGHLVYGSLSDAFGRKPLIYAGLGIYVLGSALAALAPSVEVLIAARFVQGFGASATVVIPLAMIGDEYRGPDAARLMSLATVSLSISPLLAPTFGGFIAQAFSWRAIFGVLVLATIFATVLTARALPETLPPARRVKRGPRQIAATYAALLADRRFIVPLLIATTVQCGGIVFAAGSPFILVTLHGLSPASYGMVVALHSTVIISVSQFNAALMRRLGICRLIGYGALAFNLTAGTLALLTISGMTALVPFLLLTLSIFACFGLFGPPAFVTAMEPFADRAGAAVAIGVALQSGLISLSTLVLAMLSDGTARPMTMLLAFLALCALMLWFIFVRDLRVASRRSLAG